MPGVEQALLIGIEFATDKAKSALDSLVGTVKASTVDIAANILQPLSPSNLVTQIAQQGMGINSLAGNMVNAGIGAMGQSQLFGPLVNMGAQFNMENSAINSTISQAQQLGRMFGRPTDAMIDNLYSVNFANARSDEQIRHRILETKGQDIARADAISVVKNAGTVAFNLAGYAGQAYNFVNGLANIGWGGGSSAVSNAYMGTRSAASGAFGLDVMRAIGFGIDHLLNR